MKNTIVLLLFILLFMTMTQIYAQDIVSFEVVNNASVGLTITPYEKWGMAVHDIDRNGYPDIFNIRWAAPGYSRMYVNNEGVFQEITNQTSIEAVETLEPKTRQTLWVDFDNDGDRDLSMATEDNLHLFRNDDNVFTEISTEVGFEGYKPPGFISAWGYWLGGWADYDLDGDLDCVVTQDNNKRMYLFRNDGGHFTNVSAEAGLDSTAMAEDYRFSWFDFDLDGDPDLHCRADMYRNDGGVFTNVAAEMGFSTMLGSSVTYRDFFDYDNDGDFDFFKVNGYPTSGEITEIWENRDGMFVNATEELGLDIPLDQYRGLTIGDFDNDGDPDVFVQKNSAEGLDVLLVNDEVAPGERAFADVAQFVGISMVGARKGAAFFDYNRDGFLDIYLSSVPHNHILYKNLADNGANWVGFILEGTQSNRDAVGSLVTLYTGAKKQIRYTICGNGFMRQDNPWVHFGIGYETSIDSVVIRWPLGLRQVLTNVAINQYHEIKEGEVSAVKTHGDVPFTPDAFQLEQNYPNPFNPGTQITYHLPYKCNVKLTVYNVIGREVAVLANQNKQAGMHSAIWEAIDASGAILPSGLYFYKLQAGSFTQVRKMMLVQ
ncbi:VCBS repeat-containing protein [candidate division KSB1 bacterium]|nr:VCBS repeat-containing protein [candidate division KSB1 bacterium]